MDAIGSSTKPIYIDSDGAAKPTNLSAETWTFEALDGTTTTKNVEVSTTAS